MSLKKSINVLYNDAAAENRWKAYKPVILSELDKEEKTSVRKTGDFIKLLLGVAYFLSLVFALTILLT